MKWICPQCSARVNIIFTYYTSISGTCSLCGKESRVNIYEKPPLFSKTQMKGQNGQGSNRISK